MRKERVVGFSNKIKNIKWVNWYAMHCGADGWWRSEDDPKSPIWPYPYWVARRRLRIYIIQWNILMKYHNCLCSSSVGVRDDEPQTIRIRKWLCCCCCWCTPTSNSVFNCFVCVCDRVFTFLFYYFCLFIIIIFFSLIRFNVRCMIRTQNTCASGGWGAVCGKQMYAYGSGDDDNNVSNENRQTTTTSK